MAMAIVPSEQTPRLTLDTPRVTLETEQSRLLIQVDGAQQMDAAFINLMSQKRRVDSVRQLTDRQINFFNDKSILENQFGQDSQGGLPQQLGSSNFLRSIEQYLNKWLDRFCISFASVPLIHPQEKIIWDFLHLIAILMWFVLVPLHIALPNVVSLDWVPFLVVSLGIFFFDILIYLNSSFYSQGKEIMNRAAIARHYANTRLFYDLVTYTPIIYHIGAKHINSSVFSQKQFFNSDISLLLFFLKYFNYTKIKDKIEESFNTDKHLRYKIELLELLFAMLMLAHVYACVWVYVARYEAFVGRESWVDNLKEQSGYSEIGWHEYVYAYYFATITMVTVGYGDIVPTNLLEIVVATVFVLITCGMFAFTLNSIGQIVAGMNAEHVKKNEVLQALNKYMKSRKVSMSLQYSIREYVEYYFKESLDDQRATEERIFSILSETLKKQLLLQSFKLALKDSPIFRLNFSESTIEKTIELVTELHFNPEQIVYSLEDTSSDIYFIERGEMEILINHEDSEHGSMRGGKKFGESKVIHVLKEGAVFGELEFFTGQRRHLTVRSKDFSTVLRIERAAFMSLLSEQQEDHEKFCFIRDSLINRTNYQEINVSCYACQSKLHIFRNCPLISFQTNRLQVIRDYVKSEIQTRAALPLLPNTPEDIQIEKRRTQKFHCCTKLAATQQDIEDYVQNNQEFIETYVFYQTQNADQELIYGQSDDQTPESNSESSSNEFSSDSSSDQSEDSGSNSSNDQNNKPQSFAKSTEEKHSQNMEESENESSGTEKITNSKKSASGLPKINDDNPRKSKKSQLIKEVILQLNSDGQGHNVKACTSQSDPRSKALVEHESDEEISFKIDIQQQINKSETILKQEDSQKVNKQSSLKINAVSEPKYHHLPSKNQETLQKRIRAKKILPTKDQNKSSKMSLLHHKLPPLFLTKQNFLKNQTSIEIADMPLSREKVTTPSAKQAVNSLTFEEQNEKYKDTISSLETQNMTPQQFRERASQVLPLQINVQSIEKQKTAQTFKFDFERKSSIDQFADSNDTATSKKMKGNDDSTNKTFIIKESAAESEQAQPVAEKTAVFDSTAAAEHAAEHAAYHAATANTKSNLLPIIYQSKQPSSHMIVSQRKNGMLLSSASKNLSKNMNQSQNSMLQSKASMSSRLNKRKNAGNMLQSQRVGMIKSQRMGMVKSRAGPTSQRNIPIRDRGSEQYNEQYLANAVKQAATEEQYKYQTDKKNAKIMLANALQSQRLIQQIPYQPHAYMQPGGMANQMLASRFMPFQGNMGGIGNSMNGNTYHKIMAAANQGLVSHDIHHALNQQTTNANGYERNQLKKNSNKFHERAPAIIDQLPLIPQNPNGPQNEGFQLADSNQLSMGYDNYKMQFMSLGLIMFDVKKEYEFYFPYNNATKVIAKYNKLINKNIKERDGNNKTANRMSRKSFAKTIGMKFQRQSTFKPNYLQGLTRRSIMPDEPVVVQEPRQLELDGQ